MFDQATAFFVDPSGLITVGRHGTTCPDPNSTVVGPSNDSAPVLYADVPQGDIVVSG